LSAWSRANKNDREHVAILDGLALLLVFASRGDVAAVSYWHSAGEFKLLWAKNQPVDNSSQLRYIEELLQKARDGVKTSELMNLVIPMCKEKIFRRIKKLANSFGVSLTDQREGNFNLWGFDGTKEPCQSLEAALRPGYLGNLSTIERLDNFTRSIGLMHAYDYNFYDDGILANPLFRMGSHWHVGSWFEGNVGSEPSEIFEKAGRLYTHPQVLKQIPSLKKIGTTKIVATQVREFTVCS
jgi:hypothetical protein